MRFVGNLLLAGAASLLIISPAAAVWPERTITIIVPAAPGGGADASARVLAQKMAPILGQPVVADNRSGAGGIVGSQMLTRAAPDGYTLIMGNIGPNAINYSMYKKLPYKPTDFTPITLVLSNALVLVVNAGSPFKTVGDLVAALKKEPKRYSFGSSGIGQSPHLAAEMFKQRVGVEAVHIPYKGAGPSVADLLGGQFTFMIGTLPGSMPNIQAGKLRALAVTSAQRVPELPDVPTMGEAGIKDMVVMGWFGLFAPAGTPPEVIRKIYEVSAAILLDPEVVARFKVLGGAPGKYTPSEFAEFVSAERERWKQVVDTIGLSAAE